MARFKGRPLIGRILLFIVSVVALSAVVPCVMAAPPSDGITLPLVSADISPIRELRIDDKAYAAVRTPPGKGPFPAVIFLHGGLHHASMDNLRKDVMSDPIHTRFLAWGYVTVNATRRDISHDPQDRGVVVDTLAIVGEVKRMTVVDPESVLLYGGSGGGTLALEVAGNAKLAAVAAAEPATIIYMGMFTKEHRAKDRIIAENRSRELTQSPLEELYTPSLREHTRGKLASIKCPVFLLHGDQHYFRRFNLDLLVPEMRAMGKTVEVRVYPGGEHGFDWGRRDNPAMCLKANQDAHDFFLEHTKAKSKPIDESLIKLVPVQAELADD